MPTLETVRRLHGYSPQRAIADKGYVTRDSITRATAAGVELIAPAKEESMRRAHTRQRLGIHVDFDDARFVRRSEQELRCPADRPLVLVLKASCEALWMAWRSTSAMDVGAAAGILQFLKTNARRGPPRFLKSP